MKDKIANIIIGISVTAAVIGACGLLVAGFYLLANFPLQCGLVFLVSALFFNKSKK